MKKIVSWLMAVLLFAGTFSVTASAATDMDGHWAQDIIQTWVNRGYVSGYPDGTFRPNNSISRAEFCSIINKAFGLTAMIDVFYSDVSPSDWYYPDVSKGLAAGYLDGYEDGTLRPGSAVTREDAAVMLTKLLNLTLYEVAAQKFVDVESGRTTRPYIGAVVNAAVMQGYSDNTFRPTNLISRAEAIVCLNTAMNSITLSSARYILPSFEHQTNLGGFANLANAGVPIGSNTATYSGASGNNTIIREKVNVDTNNYGSSSSRTNVAADMEVTSTSVTIRNTDIDGDLILSSRTTGTVSIIDSNISGEVYIYGRPAVTLTDTTVKTINVDSNTSTSSATRITARNTTSVKRVNVYSPVTLTESNIRRTSGGFEDVYLMSTLPRNSRVNLSGDFETIEVDAERIRVNLTNGTIEDMRVERDATNCTISLSSGVTINSMDIDARYTTVTGGGRINTCYVNAQNVTLSRRPTTVKGSETPSYNFVDDEGDGIYAATFYIKDSSGYNLRNAYVVMTNTSTGRMYSAYSNSSGEAEIPDLPYGTYDVWITSSGYVDYTESVAITRNITRTVTLTTGYSFSFYVKDSSGNPINNAAILVNNGSGGTTNSAGYVSVGLANGTYTYTVTALGYQQASGTITVAASSRYEEVIMTANPTTPATGTYTVTVKDIDDAPLAGITVTATHSTTSAVSTSATDASGVAAFTLSNGTYNVVVNTSNPTYSTRSTTVTINGDVKTLDINIYRSFDLTITMTDSVTSLAPTNESTVYINEAPHGPTASGTITITGLEESLTPYNIRIETPGYNIITDTVTIHGANESKPYTITPDVTPTFTLTVNVTTGTAGNINTLTTLDINVYEGTDNLGTLRPESRQYTSSDSDFMGENITLLISGLSPGNYFIEILADGISVDSRGITVPGHSSPEAFAL